MAFKGVPVERIREVLDANKTAEQAKQQHVRIAVEVVEGAPREMVDALKEALVPATAKGMLHVAVAKRGRAVQVNPEADACIVVCGGSDALAGAVARAWAGKGVATCLLAQSSTELPALPEDGPAVGEAVGAEPKQALARLAQWLVVACNKPLACALNFAFCRRAYGETQVMACSAANAGVGAIDLIRGADFPVMFATEAGMVSNIAAAYGYPLGVSRVPDLVAVAASGIAMRAVARKLTGPAGGLAWAVRGALGWLGTYGLGRLAIARFEAGEGFDERVAELGALAREKADDLKDALSLLAGRTVKVGPDAVYQQPSMARHVELPADVVDVAPVKPSNAGYYEVK